MKLWEHQEYAIAQTLNAWSAGYKNVLNQIPTGGGKTLVAAELIQLMPGKKLVVAHKRELIVQMSCAIARYGIRHDVVGPSGTRKAVAAAHARKLGNLFLSPKANVLVGSPQSFANVDDRLLSNVAGFIVDEAHHIQEGNIWGKLISRLPRTVIGLGLTATPTRSDGGGLGRDAGGFFDTLIQGPSPRELISKGILCDYIVHHPDTKGFSISDKDIGANGDYTRAKAKKAVQKSSVIGDIVENYIRYAAGKLGVTFVTDVETAADVAGRYRVAGIPAEVLTGKTSDHDRFDILERFERREILQLVVVDIISEGFDIPEIEVISIARPTASLVLFLQIIGRVLRSSPGKKRAIIIDHVDCIIRHGPPDCRRMWSLHGKKKRKKDDEYDIVPKLKKCLSCFSSFEAFRLKCPNCGAEVKQQIADTGSSKEKDGDLRTMTKEDLENLRKLIEVANMPVDDYRAALEAKHAPDIGVIAHCKRHSARLQALSDLKNVIAVWSGKTALDIPDVEERKILFENVYGVDVLTAQQLKTAEAEELTRRIEDVIRMGSPVGYIKRSAVGPG